MERTDRAAQPSEKPTDYVEIQASEGVILDKVFVQRDEPLALHNQDKLDEDDDFLSIASETWDYSIAGGREKEFMEALQNSQMAFECVPLGPNDSPEL
jgi:hypothetical protein